MPRLRAIRPFAVTLGVAGVIVAGALAPALGRAQGAPAAPGAPADAVRGRVVVEYAPGASAALQATVERATGTAPTQTLGAAKVLAVPAGHTVHETIARLRTQTGVVNAQPDYIAHAAGYNPDDRGFGGAHGWRRLQWNFLAPLGVDAPDAWTHLRRVHRPGGKGVTVAVLDTGVAYRRWRRFRRSPDFARTRFARGHDFVARHSLPLDRNGHGTHIAGTIAEQTDNRRGVTGLAYGATIMPVRVLDAHGEGNESAIARGIRYAARHGARVINLSLEFSTSAVTSSSQIPLIGAAIRYARRRGALVVAAAGNDADSGNGNEAPVAYPARLGNVVSVGATTAHDCRADYSNDGRGLDIVAPGGGVDDPGLQGADPNCHLAHPPAHQSVFQTTFVRRSVRRFGLPRGYYGTSMAAPHVSATAALVIASRVIGRRPSPRALQLRLERTARDLGAHGYDPHYGFGLVQAGRATAR